MSTTMQQLAEDEAAFDAYLATLEHEPEDADEMDPWELGEYVGDTWTGVIGGVRLTKRGTVRGIRLA